MGTQKAKSQLVIFVSAILCVAFLVGSSKPVLPDYSQGDDVSASGQQPSKSANEEGSARDAGGRVISRDEPTDGRPWQLENKLIATLPSIFKKPVVSRPGLQYKEAVTIDNESFPLRAYQALAMPDDPLANQAWVANSNLSGAWDMSAGSQQTTLAVIDTGFALGHEEFQNRWYQNLGEAGATAQESSSKLNCSDRGLALDYSCNLVDDNVDGVVDNESGAAPYENDSQLNCTARAVALNKSCNLIDDEGNGYIDDVSGWDMVNQDSSPQAGELNAAGDSTTHGSMVAGVAAATGNNGTGIAGADWQTKILPIQALDDDGYGDTYTVGKSIYYAVGQGVDVINISLGSDLDDAYVRQAIEAATAAGILVVASSGNDGCDCVVYPARYPEVLAVGATDQSDVIASFSSWGSSVDIVAPGTNFTVPSWSSAYPTNGYSSGVNGTSFSSPLVAGMATKLLSHQPTATPLHITAALRETTLRTHIASNNPQDVHYGYGRMDSTSVASRMTTPGNSSLAYVLSPVLAGNYFAGTRLEKAGEYSVIDCQSSPRNIRIYEAIKDSERFYTISETERRKAESQGFTTPLFANACLRMPHDTSGSIRHINIFREFRNMDPLGR